jgi:hypothetical protein
MADLTNEFSWSKSRHEKFVGCRRAYYFSYYGSWGGWQAPAGSPVRELYVLKKLSSRWQWAGSIVHAALKQLLSRAKVTGDLLPLERVLERTRARARAEWSGSREKSYWREASRITGLVEHEYGEVVADAEWKRIWEETIEGSLRAFYSSPILEEIRRAPRDRWLTVDELDSWDFEGTRVWVAVDFAFAGEDGRVHILDWKTGKERGVDHTQIAIYALYGQRKWGVAPEAVRGGLVYLGASGAPGGELVEVAADGEMLERCQREMRTSIGEMKGSLADPLRNVAREEAFPLIEDRAPCRRCAFRRPCGRL